MLGEMQFRGTWRDYQARVLDEIDTHLGDGQLHIVAAPGSGKTVLGLEAMRRIGRPALILAPSLTIRDQWRDRLFPLFLSDPHAWGDHISTDIEAPATVTITTYQALHAAYAKGAETFDALVADLSAKSPITLIVDEAHHLRREWWTALLALRDRLGSSAIVSLTATPPYDAPFAEWARYEALCGPIDSEIAIPDLVRSGDLCPHQDFIHFSTPGQDVSELLVRRRRAIEQLATTFLNDASLLDALAEHPWLINPAAYQEELLERPEYLSALMIALRTAGRSIPPGAFSILGINGRQLPPLTPAWLERLFDGLVHEPRSRTALGDEKWREVRHALGTVGLIGNKRIDLLENKDILTAMAGSTAKLDSITAIMRVEASDLGDRLRAVILSDRVRADDLPKVPDATFVATRLGVVPIFETLRRAAVAEGALAVLTGTLVILPETALPALDEEATAMGIAPGRLGRRALRGCPGFMAIDAEGAIGGRIVALITRLFQRGTIRVLIGTQALLGEGWDAPAINTLILASNAGSYMLSNQMRGRAIRIDPDAPDKVANIWHLATVEPGVDFWRTNGDVSLLARRFVTFEGIASGTNRRIESGLDRLGVDFTFGHDVQNSRTLAEASDRAGVAAKWHASLGDATVRSHVRQVAAVDYAPQRLAWRNTLQALIVTAVSGGAFEAAKEMLESDAPNGLLLLVTGFLGATFLYSLPQLARAGFLYWRNGTLERSLVQVGGVLVACLCRAGALQRDATDYAVVVKRSITGRCDIFVEGATRAEERIFLGALAELLGPVQNPRYLLVRRSRLWRRSRADYHAVPALLAARKELAAQFQAEWTRRIGASRLIFTRTGAGRRELLRARVQSFSAGMQRSFERRSVWM